MASEANKLRQLAKQLRVESEKREEKKMEKCAQVLVAAVGLDLLRKKVTTNG